MRRYEELAPLLTTKDGITYRGGLPFVDFLYDGEVKYHKVDNNEAGRLDLIAYKWFNDPSLFWVIAIFNGIRDPISEVTAGKDLAIPISPFNNTNFRATTYLEAK